MSSSAPWPHVMKQIGGTVLASHFTAETCRAYQYDLAARGLQTGSIRVRLATLGSMGKWAVRRDTVVQKSSPSMSGMSRPAWGLRRVQGKDGTETAVPLPTIARSILAGYVATVRPNAKASDPLFVSRFKTKGGHLTEARMKGHRVWKITKAIGIKLD